MDSLNLSVYIRRSTKSIARESGILKNAKGCRRYEVAFKTVFYIYCSNFNYDIGAAFST